MIRNKKDIDKELIVSAIRILSKTASNKKPLKLKVIDVALTILLYSIIAASIVIPIILIS